LDECAVFTRDSFTEISLLFYDVSREEMPRVLVDQMHLFADFMAAEPMAPACHGELPCPDPVIGLLVLFASFFERAHTYAQIMSILQVPSCPASLKAVLHAIYRYRCIREHEQYGNRFSEILVDLSVADPPVAHAILAEYFATGFLSVLALDSQKAGLYRARFTDPNNQRRYPVLTAPAMLRLYELTSAQLFAELAQLNIRAVEALYDIACHYVAPFVAPDPTTGEISPDIGPRHITLPAYIDALIFGRDGLAGFTDRRINVRLGLDADNAQQRAYLARYFPKSFAESYSIFRALFSNQHIAQAIPGKRGVLTILNIGSGTGGDTAGLLEAIADSGHTPDRIDIYSVEGNELALQYQQQIVTAVAVHKHLAVRLIPHHVVFPTTRDGFAERLAQLLATLPTSYHLILTWKSFNEYYHHNRALAQGIYRAFLEAVAPTLTRQGICVVLDVADSVNGDKEHWFPIMMNNEVKAYLQNPTALLAHVLPLSCANWAAACATPLCYTQRMFLVSHSRDAAVECKTVYKIMAHRPFANALTQPHRHVRRFRCNSAKPHLICVQGAIVSVSPTAVIPDGFELT
jgi:hypothetical protein